MKFKVSTLESAVDAALKTNEKNAKERERIVEETANRRLVQWQKEQLGRFREYRDFLTAKIKTGVITKEDINNNAFGTLHAYHDIRKMDKTVGYYDLDDTGKKQWNQYPQLNIGDVVQLQTLKKILAAVEDEFISDNQLSKLGFSGSAIQTVFRNANL